MEPDVKSTSTSSKNQIVTKKEGKRSYKNKYNKEWEHEELYKDWIAPDPLDKFVAICRFCHKSLRPNVCDLRKHIETKKHQRNADCKGSHLERLDEIDRKRRELRVATYVACQTSINVIDDLSVILNMELGDSSFRMHHNKCRALIESVLAPHFRGALMADLADKPFSIFIHRPNVADAGFICLCVRYYSAEIKQMVSTFLGIVDVESCQAKDAVVAIKALLKEMNMTTGHLVGVAIDGTCPGCDQMLALLRHDVPCLVSVKCVCHSLDLVFSKAMREMPDNLEFMIRETYNWLHHHLDQPSCRKLCKLIQTDLSVDDVDNFCRPYSLTEHFKEPTGPLPADRCRSLLLVDCVERVLDHYEALRHHFSAACDTDNCYRSQLLRDLYENSVNRAYLSFLRPILTELRAVNELFQTDRTLFGGTCSSPELTPDTHFLSVHEALNTFFVDLCFRLIKPGVLRANQSTIHDLNFSDNDGSIFLGLVDIDFGESFDAELKKLGLSRDAELLMLNRCFRFLKTLVVETAARFSKSKASLQKMRSILPANFRNNKFPPTASLPLKFFSCPRNQLEEEIKMVGRKDWGDAWNNVEKFWIGVHSYKDTAGKCPFENLASGAMKILTVPLSNHEVEHVFSVANSVGRDPDRGIKLPLLTAILYIRYGLRRINMSCSEFLPPNTMLRSFSCEEYD